MSSTSNVPKSHHYVPQFILRDFTDDSGKLHCFNGKKGKMYQSTPRNAFKQRSLYTYRYEDGSASTHLEASLSKLESEVSGIVRRIRCKVRSGCSISLTAREHVIWGKFLITQIARHPDRRSRSQLLAKYMTPAWISDYERKYGPVRPEAKGCCLDPKMIKWMANNMFIETTKDRDIYSKLAPELASRNIVALVADKKAEGFVIGDVGVIRFPKAGQYLLHPETQLIYPISWNIVLAWGFPWEGKDVIAIPHDKMRTVNELTFNQSNIIAGRAKELIESLSRKPNK